MSKNLDEISYAPTLVLLAFNIGITVLELLILQDTSSVIVYQVLAVHTALTAAAVIASFQGRKNLTIAGLAALPACISLKSPHIDALCLLTLGGAALVHALMRRRSEPVLQTYPGTNPQPLPAWFGSIAAAAFFFVALALNLLVFGGSPKINDSAVQLFHGRIIAGGAFAAPIPPVPEVFEFQSLEIDRVTGRWYSPYPPGHLLFLALGWLVGFPGLVNPVLGAIAVLLFHAIARRILGTGMYSLFATVAFALSPFVLFMSSEFMNHATSLLAVSATLYAAVRLHDAYGTEPARWWIMLGCSLGLAVLARPLTALAIGLPIVTWALIRGWRRCESVMQWVGRVSVLGLPLLIAAVLFTWYNLATNGDPLRYGLALYWGFMPANTESIESALLTRLAQTTDNVAALNLYIAGWPIPVLFLVILHLAGRGRSYPFDRLLVAIVAALVLIYAPFIYQDLCFGPRYLYEATPAVLLLAVRGLERFREDLGSLASRAVVVACLVCPVFADAWLGAAVYGREDYWGNLTSVVAREAKNRGIDRALILISDGDSFHGSAWQNDPFLREDNLYVRDLPEYIPALRSAFPDRSILRWRHGSEKPFIHIAGPPYF